MTNTQRVAILKLAFTIVVLCCIETSCTKQKNYVNNKHEAIKKKNTLKNKRLKSIYPIRATNKNRYWVGDEDTLTLSIANQNFTIYPKAILKWGHADSIKLSEDMFVAKAYFYLDKNDLFLFCEMSDNENGTSNIFRINLTNKKIKWVANLAGFNLGQPSIRNNFAYVTAIGTIGKLNLETGKYIYEKTDLYDNKTNSFNDFSTILFNENKTLFIAKRSFSNLVDTIIINETSNKMTIRKQK